MDVSGGVVCREMRPQMRAQRLDLLSVSCLADCIRHHSSSPAFLRFQRAYTAPI